MLRDLPDFEAIEDADLLSKDGLLRAQAIWFVQPAGAMIVKQIEIVPYSSALSRSLMLFLASP
jgi:hypothetical protein